jgi:hypothetical protein
MSHRCFARRAAVRAAACLTLAAGAAVLGPATIARAAPEEVEVYRDDLDRKGAFALETNQNYVFSGSRDDVPSGTLGPVHLYRLTPELSYGLSDHWEAGMLLMSTVRAGAFDVHGAKARIRYIAPRPVANPWYWGFNLETGWTDRHLEDRPWTVELRGIAGYEGRRWILSVNPTVETAADDRAVEPASMELQSKIGYRLTDRLIVGLESYNELGPVRRFSALRDEPQMLYAVTDIELPRGELNLGVGRGLTGSSDGWAVKAVWGIPLSPRQAD